MRAKYPRQSVLGLVSTYDEKPRRRLWEPMKLQGMQENQQVVFMSDGGENVRRFNWVQFSAPKSELVEFLFIFASDKGTIQVAVNAIHKGAYDYLAKPINPAQLIVSLQRPTSHSKPKV